MNKRIKIAAAAVLLLGLTAEAGSWGAGGAAAAPAAGSRDEAGAVRVGAAKAAAASAVTGVLLNDKHIDVGRIRTERGTALVPLRPLAAAMGYTMAWDAGKRQAALLRPARRVTVTAGSATASVYGTAAKLALPARVIGGTLYVPLASAARTLGGTVRLGGGELYITDPGRYVTASREGGTYWVSQTDGALYARMAGQAEPVRIGTLPVKNSPYLHSLTLRSAGNGTVLLELADRHYAMFNNFENVYQALLRGTTLLGQADYHLGMAAYNRTPGPADTQLYLFDGAAVRLVLANGSLGAPLDLKTVTGEEGGFRVEYAAPDVLLIRSLGTSRLYAVDPKTGKGTDLGAALMDEADRKEWERADGSDPYILEKMLTLTKREGSKLTFVYSPIPDGAPKTKTYTLGAPKK